MADAVENFSGENAEQQEKVLDAHLAQIDAQKEKVERAETVAEASREEKKLDALLEKFDALLERMTKVEEKASEPVVSPPPAKETPAEPQDEEVQEPSKPSRRRLGAWGKPVE